MPWPLASLWTPTLYSRVCSWNFFSNKVSEFLIIPFSGSCCSVNDPIMTTFLSFLSLPFSFFPYPFPQYLSMQLRPRIASNSRLSFLKLWSAAITGMYHCAQHSNHGLCFLFLTELWVLQGSLILEKSEKWHLCVWPAGNGLVFKCWDSEFLFWSAQQKRWEGECSKSHPTRDTMTSDLKYLELEGWFGS